MQPAGAEPVRIEFAAQFRVSAEAPTVCTDNVITIDQEGVVLLHMQLLPNPGPVLDLAIPPNSPVSIVGAVVSAIVNAAASSGHPGSSPAS